MYNDANEALFNDAFQRNASLKESSLCETMLFIETNVKKLSLNKAVCR